MDVPLFLVLIPAQAGIHLRNVQWTPAFAGATEGV